ncbi:MAG TPA: A/G-specific adenine glycosylase [bacterium]|nr:A/G-specific adenine glycosylase [bacterium]
MDKVSSAAIAAFRRSVYAHYARHRRPLPWRRTRDPYRIMVSELMLQQTQVDRVIPKYEAFIKLFPDVRSLARSPFGAVAAAWQGLGYNRRAKYLHDAARVVVSALRGTMPSTVEGLDSLPGIGAHTAAAICAYAYGQPVIYIETNIRSVFIHHFFSGERSVSDARILPLVERALDRKDPRRWYNALMDYGTALKERHGNPSRRSAHYARQSRFEGSLRQMRGAVMKILACKKAMTISVLSRALRNDARLPEAVAGLSRDGLVAVRGCEVSL